MTNSREIAVKALASHVENPRALVYYLNRAGATLNTRWANECSYEWAGNSERYCKATESREKTLLANAVKAGLTITRDVNERRNGAFIMLQTDPRGWPITLFVNGLEYSLGGRD